MSEKAVIYWTHPPSTYADVIYGCSIVSALGLKEKKKDCWYKINFKNQVARSNMKLKSLIASYIRSLKSKNELWKTLLNHCRTVLWFLRQTARQRLRGRLLQPRYRCELAPGWCLLDLFVLFGLVGLDHGLVFGWINYRKSCLWSPTPSWGIGNFPSFRQEIHSAFYSKTITKEFLITSWWNSLTTFYLKCKSQLLKEWFWKFYVNVM